MKKFLLLGVIVFVVVFLGNIGAFAHDLYTKNGCTVNHGEYGYCGPTGCPIADSTFETAFSFDAADRVLSGTGSFNCHGRTFDNRQCWIPFADIYLDCDWPMCPATPAYGDAIIWFNSDGSTKHSATIISSWDGTDTTIKSKYGKQGEYWHSLSNCIRAYGSNWSITRFAAGTTIYSESQVYSTTDRETYAKKMLEKRKSMPWYKDVLESEKIYNTEGRQIIEKITSLLTESRNNYEAANSTEEKVEILFNDFVEDYHYKWLVIFNSPQFSTEYIHGIEAGRLLVEICANQPEFRELIADRFTELVLKDWGNYPDPIKGAAIFFLGKILNRKQQLELIKSVENTVLSNIHENQSNVVPTYAEFYLQQLQVPQEEKKPKGTSRPDILK